MAISHIIGNPKKVETYEILHVNNFMTKPMKTKPLLRLAKPNLMMPNSSKYPPRPWVPKGSLKEITTLAMQSLKKEKLVK